MCRTRRSPSRSHRFCLTDPPGFDPPGIPAGGVGFDSLYRCGYSVVSPPCLPGAGSDLGASAIRQTEPGVAAPVRPVAEELVEQVAVRAVDLDAVEARGLRGAGRRAERLDHARQLVVPQFVGRDVGFHPVGRVGLACDRDGARRDRRRAAEWTPGAPGNAAFPAVTIVASATISPALARWA
jgi:hypothetical protein